MPIETSLKCGCSNVIRTSWILVGYSCNLGYSCINCVTNEPQNATRNEAKEHRRDGWIVSRLFETFLNCGCSNIIRTSWILVGCSCNLGSSCINCVTNEPRNATRNEAKEHWGVGRSTWRLIETSLKCGCGNIIWASWILVDFPCSTSALWLICDVMWFIACILTKQ
jgi:hypothetical protein